MEKSYRNQQTGVGMDWIFTQRSRKDLCNGNLEDDPKPYRKNTHSNFEQSWEKKLQSSADTRFSYTNSLFLFREEKHFSQCHHLEAIFFTHPMKYVSIISLFFFSVLMHCIHPVLLQNFASMMVVLIKLKLTSLYFTSRQLSGEHCLIQKKENMVSSCFRMLSAYDT